MAYVVTLEGFTPGVRYDNLPWTDALIQESSLRAGPWTTIATIDLASGPGVDPTGLDSNPAVPASRSFTVSTATLEQGWYRVVFEDAAGATQASDPVYSPTSSDTQDAAPQTLGDLVEQVRVEGEFDVEDSQIRRWLNDRHMSMCADAGWMRTETVIGQTVAGVNTYAIDLDTVQILGVWTGTDEYLPGARDEFAGFTTGRLRRSDSRGAFRLGHDSSGQEIIVLYPTPDESGVDITVHSVVLPRTLTDDTDEPAVPADMHPYLVAGAIAEGLARIDERLDESRYWEERFREGVVKLRQRRIARVSVGATQIRIQGVHF